VRLQLSFQVRPQLIPVYQSIDGRSVGGLYRLGEFQQSVVGPDEIQRRYKNSRRPFHVLKGRIASVGSNTVKLFPKLVSIC
jgi:hypothetical protein